MPTPITRGAASALGFGFLSVSKTHWITFGNAPSTLVNVYAGLDSSLTLVSIAGGSGITPFVKISDAGTVSYQTYKYSFTGNFDYDMLGVAIDTATNYTWAAGTLYNYTTSRNNSVLIAYDTSNGPVINKGTSTAYFEYNDLKVSGSNIVVCGSYLLSTTYGIHVGIITKSTGLYSSSKLLTQTGATITGKAVTVDGSGNIYALGSGGTTIIVKYDSALNLQWQTQMSSTAPSDITTDSAGNVYVCAANSVQKFNSSGTLQWQRTIATGSGSKNVALRKLAVDSSNNIYSIGTLTDTTGTAIYRAVVVKYNSSGTLQWIRILYRSSGAPAEVTYGQAIAVDSASNNFYVSCKDGNGVVLLTAKLPLDGTLTGSYSQASPAITYTYADPSWTDAAGAFTQTTPTYTDAAGSTAQSNTTAPSNLTATETYYKLPV
jgi:hypothetical protein